MDTTPLHNAYSTLLDAAATARLFQDHLTLACAPGLVMLFGVERAGW